MTEQETKKALLGPKDAIACMTPGCGCEAYALAAFDNGTTSWHCAECMSPVTPEEDIADLEALFKLEQI